MGFAEGLPQNKKRSALRQNALYISLQAYILLEYWRNGMMG